ncbi:MAG TPA: lysophospholipid acyltransferase family protein [Gemmatimonadaceae bacterium]|nr:lysophospholipid acyltransferase family protein [Gemmatimonadaceae bacterium]
MTPSTGAERYTPPTFGDRAEYLALRTLIRGLGLVRWERAAGAGARLAALGYRPFGIRRHVVERQIAAAFPELTPGEVADLSRASFEHLGRVAVETALLPKMGREGVMRLVQCVDGWDVVERAMAPGRGMIFVTGHLGNWELGGAYIAARGVPLDVVVRRMSNPLFDAYLNGTRLRVGMTVVYDSEAVRRTPRALRVGRAVAFLADQGILHLASTFVPFFGRPAKTPRGPAVFALRWNVPMVFGTMLRQPGGRYRMIFEELPVEDTGDREGDVDRVVARYTQVLERWVRVAPEQYFWQHRRWKRQPADTPPELRDPV